MKFLDKLFSNKKQVANNRDTQTNVISEKKEKLGQLAPSFHLRGVADSEGLYPSEIVMLHEAEKYKTNESQFPHYLTSTYEITNPSKMLMDLNARGYLVEGNSVDSIIGLKLPELKEIATNCGITVSGKKSDIIDRLSEVGEETLSLYIKDHFWKLTGKGRNEIDANPYIGFFLEKHEYSLSDVGVDIWAVNKGYLSNTKRPYRDAIWELLNKTMFDSEVDFQRNPSAPTSELSVHCNCYRIMGLFVEEENKSYINALDYYLQYIYKTINLLNGWRLLTACKLFAKDKKRVKELINSFYNQIMILPFQKEELLRLIDKANITSERMRDTFITSFKRADDKGIMTPEEVADFLILELSGKTDKSRDMAVRVAQKYV